MLQRFIVPCIALALVVAPKLGAVRHHRRHTSAVSQSVAGLLWDGMVFTDTPYTDGALYGRL